jgi:hypothetical protein
LKINQYDVRNRLSLSIDLIDAYPIAVNQLDLDWGSDAVHKLSVTFAYTSWRSNDINVIATEFLEYRVVNGQWTTNSRLGNDMIPIGESLAPGEQIVS